MDWTEIVKVVLAGVASISGMLAAASLRAFIGRGSFGRKRPSPKPYGERLTELISSLMKATGEVDDILLELADVAKERETAVAKLQVDLATLQSQEKELREHVDLLQHTPVPVAEHFARLVARGERRSARRDYVLFGSGVLVTTLIAILIQVWVR